MRPSALHLTLVGSVVWTLGLLLLGSVVHATESSLACPDWPTCFGTMMPEMVGGVFWEHLHRLVAGGLILIFAVATWLAARQGAARWIVRTAFAGLALLFVQAVFGGLTVIYRLPDAISTTHLGLAFIFLVLAVVLATATSPRWSEREPLSDDERTLLRSGGVLATVLVFTQSVLGAVVRHTDAGMACGNGVLCNGGVLPSAWNSAIAIHWSHRVGAVVISIVVVAFAMKVLNRTSARWLKTPALLSILLVAGQVALGLLSVTSILAVVPVSLHTAVGAALLAVCALFAAWGWIAERDIAALPPNDAPVAPLGAN